MNLMHLAVSNPTVERLGELWPEMALLLGACVCLATGLSHHAAVRKSTAVVAGAFIALALGLLLTGTGTPGDDHPLGLGQTVLFLKAASLSVGFVLLLIAARTPGHLKQIVNAEAGERFEPGDDFRGEFFAFFLFSLSGVLFTVGARDLVWLFLALELTSLPTYVLVAIARDKAVAQESAVKYFFLGALSAAVFLYGFTLIYAATGFTDYASIRGFVTETQLAGRSLPALLMLGMVLSILGIAFKIAAVPMHFYAADVYQGAAVPVTSMLAFVPKTAGFAALIGLLSLVGWSTPGANGQLGLPPLLAAIIAVLAVVTMTYGNVLGLLQNNVKRTLAYSSIAQSGYMLVGLLAGPMVVSELGLDRTASPLGDGIAAIAFYLVAYGLGTIGSFAVLGCLHGPNGDEADTYDDLSGLRVRHPFLAGTLLIACLSLLGFPFTVGFLGKFALVTSGFQAGYSIVVVIMMINSAISAAYYLRIGSVCFFGADRGTTVARYVPVRVTGAIIASVLALGLGFQGEWLVEQAGKASMIAPADTTPPDIEVTVAQDPSTP